MYKIVTAEKRQDNRGVEIYIFILGPIEKIGIIKKSRDLVVRM